MKSLQQTILILTIFILTVACSNDDHEQPSEGLTVYATVEVPDSEYQVIMYLDEGKTLEVGFNHYYMGLYNSDGTWMENAHLSLLPMMDMNESEMMHTAPYLEHEHDHSAHKLQEYETVFVMPSTAGNWTLEIDVLEHDSEFQGHAVLPINVQLPTMTKMKSEATELGDLFISLVEPEAYAVGTNDFELTIHKRENMMSWPTMENLTIEIEPEMPAMGHGSPNNVNPVHQAQGHYKGVVNFTMTGDWVIHVTIKSDGTIITQQSFDVIL